MNSPSLSLTIIFAVILPLSLVGCVSNSGTQISPSNARSLKLPKYATAGHAIPLLDTGAVPQGMTYHEEKNLLLTSYYYKKEVPSCISVMDYTAGDVLHHADLMEPDGSMHYGHVGGLVIESTNLWVASDAYLYRYNLKDMLSNTNVSAQARFKTEAALEVAFCSFYENMVWAGEFALADEYPTASEHRLAARDGTAHRAWICGYDPRKGFEVAPQRVLSIPDRVQAMVATSDYIFLSRSYGRRNRSSLEIYHNPLKKAPHQTVQTSKDEAVPLWFLDGENHVRSIDLPPMAENMTLVDGKMEVLFESGADAFKWFGKTPLRHILMLQLEEL